MSFTVGMAIEAEVAQARSGLADVRRDIERLRPPMRDAGREATDLERAMASAAGAISGRLVRLGLQAAGITSVTAALVGSVRAAAEAERSQLRLQAVVRATGGAAGRSAEEIEALARAIGRETLASTEGVRAAAAQLLTFRSVAGDTFDRTLRAAQDLAEVGFGSVESAAVQLGKALEDPEQGLAALRRVGVSFSASQREVIAQLVETGRVAEAQRIILEGVERQVGGAGAAAGGGLAGAFDTLGEELRQFGANLGQRIAESLNLAGALGSIAGGISAVNAAMERQPTARDSARDLIALRAQRERVANDPRTLADPMYNRSVLADLDARIARERQEFERRLAAEDRTAAERSAMEGQTQAELAAEAEEAAKRIATAAGTRAAASGGAAAAVRAETSAVRQLIDQLGREIDLQRETDPVRRALIEHRETLAGATAAERAAVEGLVATLERERVELEQGRAMWETFGRTATDALGAIALQGRSLKDVLGGVIRMLAQAALQAALLGTGPLAGLFGGGILPAVFPVLRRAGGGPVFGPGGPTDDRVPILASNGEFVVNALATARNRPLLEAINAGAPGFAAGGMVGPGWTGAGGRPDRLGDGSGAWASGWGGGVVNHFHVQTPDPAGFARSRATVARGARRLLAQAERFA